MSLVNPTVTGASKDNDNNNNNNNGGEEVQSRSLASGLVGYCIEGGNLELVEVLGVGGYGVVYKAFDRSAGVHVAVKALIRDASLTRRQLEFQDCELQLHSRVHTHASVLSLYRILYDDCLPNGDARGVIYVVMELASYGDLFTMIIDQGLYRGRDDVIRSVFLQVIDAVEACHEAGVYHRDLKPENIMVTSQDGTVVKLTDFSLSTTELLSCDYGCGSTFYMSPECLEPAGQSYNAAANDVWSLGIILINLICGRNPWKSASASKDKVYQQYLADRCTLLLYILNISVEVNEILVSILEPNPELRITLPVLRSMIEQCGSFSDESNNNNNNNQVIMSPSLSTSKVAWTGQPTIHGQEFTNMPITPADSQYGGLAGELGFAIDSGSVLADPQQYGLIDRTGGFNMMLMMMGNEDCYGKDGGYYSCSSSDESNISNNYIYEGEQQEEKQELMTSTNDAWSAGFWSV